MVVKEEVLSRALFNRCMNEEARRRAEKIHGGDLKIAKTYPRDESFRARLDRVLDVMWSKTKLDVRAECEKEAKLLAKEIERAEGLFDYEGENVSAIDEAALAETSAGIETVMTEKVLAALVERPEVKRAFEGLQKAAQDLTDSLGGFASLASVEDAPKYDHSYPDVVDAVAEGIRKRAFEDRED